MATMWSGLGQRFADFRFLLRFMFGRAEGPDPTVAGGKLEEASENDADGFYYGYMIGRGRDFLADELQCAEPFKLSPAEIVERVLAAGYRPNLEHERRRPFATQGDVATVALGDQCFVVSVDVPAETIVVQEVRARPYERET